MTDVGPIPGTVQRKGRISPRMRLQKIVASQSRGPGGGDAARLAWRPSRLQSDTGAAPGGRRHTTVQAETRRGRTPDAGERLTPSHGQPSPRRRQKRVRLGGPKRQPQLLGAPDTPQRRSAASPTL